MQRRHLKLAGLACGLMLATPAMAQFPPPGVYACADATGANVGTLTLLVAGDYAFAAPDGSNGSGQVASAASSVDPLSGPLKDMGLTGAFETDASGNTMFRFTGSDGVEITCSEAPA